MPATLLLADDSTTIQRFVQLTFADEDVHVVAAADGEAARQRIDADPPDIVLADVAMPKLDGYAVAAHVKRSPSLKHIPVLLLTGAFEPIDEDKARASGCDGILVKPIQPQRLVGCVKELLAGHRAEGLWPKDLLRTAPAAPLSPSVEPPMAMEVPVRADAGVERMPTTLPTPGAAFGPIEVRAQTTPSALQTPPVPVPPRPVTPPADLAPPVESSASSSTESRPATPEPRDWDFLKGMEELDAGFADLDADLGSGLDDETVSDFARDLNIYRTGDPSPAPPVPPTPSPPPPSPAPAPAAPPAGPSASAVHPGPGATLPAAESSSPAVPVAPAAPVLPQSSGIAPLPASSPAESTQGLPPTEERGTPPFTRISMANAFAALLAAEQTQPARAGRPPTSPMSDAAIEDAVKRVLARMTEQTVRQIVQETAERLIREEIERMRSNPEPRAR